MIERNDQLSPREYEQMNYDRDMTEKAYAQAIKIKELDIQAAKLEAKLSSWFKIPLTIIKLPLLLLCVIPLSIYAARKEEVPSEYWKLLR